MKSPDSLKELLELIEESIKMSELEVVEEVVYVEQ